MPPCSALADVFAGSGSVLMATARHAVEVLNDINGDIVNFFEVVREPELREQLAERMLWTPYSRAVFEGMVGGAEPSDQVLRAWRFYAIARMTFGGYRPGLRDMHGNNFAPVARGKWRRAMDVRAKAMGVGRTAGTLHRQIDALDAIGERLRGVFIERKDFSYILSRWDGPETLFYCDPPYVGTEGYYNNGDFGAVRHVELANMLGRILGRAMVSYRPHESLDALYPEGRWRRVTLDAVYNVNQTKPGVKKPKVKELLIMNYGEDGERLSG